ncbi:MAG: glutamate--tRNA ligase [Deltaproteobacteria bacterium]|nr:MAG: glutamate--tRNA ligase [Deltaproteobacteria bacterium]
MEKIITRFPPSPTGYLHVGGARTALFNWLYARHMNGKFILRIEDTDVVRSTQNSVDAILNSLEWLGINWDEGPYFQTRRFHIYEDYIQKLINSGHAYYCTCLPEELDIMRKKAAAAGEKPKYDGTCRNKGLARTDNAVVRFKAPLSGITIVNDIIKGKVVFQNNELDDFIIQRSNGTYTYNFVVVVDDISMKINTIIRGDDHLNNTPRQILLYQALESEIPSFAHVPMVLGKDKTRLSKRHGAMSVTAYKDMGYLPDALLNYLVRLGWSYGDQEFFQTDELIEKFTLENIGRSPGIFDQEKLLSINAEHIKRDPPARIAKHLLPFLKEQRCTVEEDSHLESVIRTLNKRSKTLKEMAEGALFYFTETVSYDEKAVKKFLKPSVLKPLKLLLDRLQILETFNEKNLEKVFENLIKDTEIKFGKIAQPVRVALTGKTVSPGIFEIIEVLGKKKVVSRLKKAIELIANKT